MVVVECIPKAIVNHNVNHRSVEHSRTETSARNCIRSVAHVLGTTADNDVSFAGFDLVCCKSNTLKTGTADDIDGHSGCLDRQTSLDGNLTSDVLAKTSLKDITENNFINLLRLNACAVKASLTTVAPSSAGLTFFSVPPKDPIAVLHALTITTSFMFLSPFQKI
jgi:hypothetical protein